MTKAQAQQLLSRVDTTCAEFLERLAADRGTLTWGETKALFEVRNWEAFATGPGKQIAREVRDEALADVADADLAAATRVLEHVCRVLDDESGD